MKVWANLCVIQLSNTVDYFDQTTTKLNNNDRNNGSHHCFTLEFLFYFVFVSVSSEFLSIGPHWTLIDAFNSIIIGNDNIYVCHWLVSFITIYVKIHH